MTKCKCDKHGKQETVRSDMCLSWMCWDCSSVNEEQHIFVDKSNRWMDLFGHAKNTLLIS